MIYRSIFFSVFLFLFSFFPGMSKAHSTNTGILLVTFGSSYPQAQNTYKFIESKVKAAFPNTPVYLAYTSKKIRHKLAKQGIKVDSPELALAKMLDQGFTQVVVQSLHIIPGEEFNYLKQVVKNFANLPKGFKKIVLGKPLLYSTEDLKKVVDALYPYLPNLKKQEALLFMGHGTEHAADVYYSALNYWLAKKNKNLFLATVEGTLSLDSLLPQLIQKQVKKVYLMPFMSVVGDHANNDLAGKEKDSWANLLKKHHIEPKPYLKGLGEMEKVVAIWIKHLKEAYKELEN